MLLVKDSYATTYLEQDGTVSVSQLSGKVAVPCKAGNGLVKRVKSLDKELRPCQHSILAAALRRQALHALGSDPFNNGVMGGIEELGRRVRPELLRAATLQRVDDLGKIGGLHGALDSVGDVG
jgi:hypothetical protein